MMVLIDCLMVSLAIENDERLFMKYSYANNLLKFFAFMKSE